MFKVTCKTYERNTKTEIDFLSIEHTFKNLGEAYHFYKGYVSACMNSDSFDYQYKEEVIIWFSNKEVIDYDIALDVYEY